MNVVAVSCNIEVKASTDDELEVAELSIATVDSSDEKMLSCGDEIIICDEVCVSTSDGEMVVSDSVESSPSSHDGLVLCDVESVPCDGDVTVTTSSSPDTE